VEVKMSSDLLLNLLGVNQSSALRAISQLGSSSATDDSFAGVLAAAMSQSGSSRTVADIVSTVGSKYQYLIEQISSAATMAERLSLAEEFRGRVIAALQAAGYSASAGGDADKIIVNGTTYDILRSLNTLGAQTAVQAISVNGASGTTTTSTGGWTRSASEVVFSVAGEHSDLIEKINNAATLEERVGYARDLKRIIVDALNKAGHSAQFVDDADTIVVDGQIYDIFRGIKAVGQDTAVQMLWVGGAEGGSSSNPVVAILSTGVSLGTELLNQINSTSDLEERKQLATELRQMVLKALEQAGFTVDEGEDADEIVVNGQTYDFIRRLYYPDETATIQALLVA
jgi:hypothetical protein